MVSSVNNTLYLDAWMPATMLETEYLEVALPAITPIFGLEMLGSLDTGAYVTSFTLLHSDDGHVYSVMTDDQGKPKVFSIFFALNIGGYFYLDAHI